MESHRIPNPEMYKKTCIRLAEDNHLETLIAVRCGCEMGMTRIEIVNAKASNLDRYHPQGLWVEIAKKISCRGGQIMRSREIPVNPDLYMILKNYIMEDQIYLLRRKRGDPNKPFARRYINEMYTNHGVSWTTHASRHFFKNCMYDWMRRNRQIDVALVKSLMGHTLNVHESYGSLSWKYKKGVVDDTFENVLVYEYDEIMARFAKQIDVPIEKIKFMYELFSGYKKIPNI